jgi:chlorobactene glucosyltransferase
MDDDAWERLHFDLLADLSRRDARLRVIHGSDLPSGWAGKPHALYQASAAARGDWLCVVDADTFSAPEAIAACYVKAIETKADLFTIMTFQELGTFWEKVLMPLVLTAMSVGFSPRKVNDPNERVAVANGQFIFIKRSVYDAIGGHEKVKDQIVEDKALSEQVKWNGYRLIVAGGHAVAPVMRSARAISRSAAAAIKACAVARATSAATAFRASTSSICKR